MSTQRAGRRRRRRYRVSVAVAVATALVTSVLSIAGLSSAASADYKLSVGDHVGFSDGSPAAGVKVDVFQAVNRWTRGAYLGTATTGSDGGYGFEVAQGCYITVALAPLGTEFDFVGSGKMYDQSYGCVEGSPNNNFDSVLYREAAKPPPPPPPTHPPSTQPPPTTTPPTTQPPADPPHLVSCAITHDRGGGWGGTGWIIGGLKIEGEIPEGAVVALLDGYGNVLERQQFIDSDFDLYVYRIGVERSANVANGFYTIGENNWRISGVRGWRQLRLEYPDQKDPKDVKCRYEFFSPIGLDVDGSNAVERIDGEFTFDFDADGETEVVAEWFAPTEGVLFDARIDGPVTGAHLFGDQGGRYADGYAKLATLDTDGNGFVEGGELNGLAVWTDANSNARLDSGERSSLGAHGIVALSTTHVDFVSEAVLADGSTMVTEDLWFPSVTAAVGPTGNLTLVGLGLTALALVGLSFGAAGRRRDDLDRELAEFMANERSTHLD